MKKIIITAGGTSEKIDNVRKITNSSTGKLGMLIAEQFLQETKDTLIYYICSKHSLRPENERIKIIEINSTLDLKNTIEHLLVSEQIYCVINSMAVSDYTTDYVSTIDRIKQSLKKNDNIEKAFNKIDKIKSNKISSNEDNLVIFLKPTPKIISVIKDLSPSTLLVGFKLLDGVTTQELINVAKNLRDKNNCDLVVANDLTSIRKGNHVGFIIDKKNNVSEASGKENIAKMLVNKVICSDNDN